MPAKMALRAPGMTYCLRSPQYLCGLLSQQPDFMQADWRSPQLVRQVDIDERSTHFLQAAIQTFSSPLQRIGAETAGAAESRAIEIATSAAILRRKHASRESIRGVMPLSYGGRPLAATPGIALLAPAACD